MNAPAKLPLFNHVIPILEDAEEEVAGVPVSDSETHAFVALHQKHRVISDGVAHRAIPIDEAVAWLVAHKDDPAALDPVALFFHNRNVIVDLPALRRGETDKAKLLTAHDPRAFLKTDGSPARTFLPVDLLFVCRCYAHHQRAQDKPAERVRPSGGHHSRRALTALDDFLESVLGIKANHLVIRQGDWVEAVNQAIEEEQP